MEVFKIYKNSFIQKFLLKKYNFFYKSYDSKPPFVFAHEHHVKAQILYLT